MNGVRILVGRLVARVELDDSVFSVLDKVCNFLHSIGR